MSPTLSQPRRKQDQKYWDKMAARWDREIFNTLDQDRSKVIAEEIRRSAVGAGSVADFGCGIGIYLPLLSKLFDTVHGFERSRACVGIARSRYDHVDRISIDHSAAAVARHAGEFDVVLCVNVAIHPTARGRASVMRAVETLLAPGGTLILVVPCFESATMVARAESAALQRRRRAGSGDWDVDTHGDGVVAIEGLPTKHFTRNELRSTLHHQGWKVKRVRRVEYSWQSQGVPSTGQELPWDWIAVATRA